MGRPGRRVGWATEYGEPTSSVDEATQADYIRDFLTTWRSLPYTGPAFIYTLRDRNRAAAVTTTRSASTGRTGSRSRP